MWTKVYSEILKNQTFQASGKQSSVPTSSAGRSHPPFAARLEGNQVSLPQLFALIPSAAMDLLVCWVLHTIQLLLLLLQCPPLLKTLLATEGTGDAIGLEYKVFKEPMTLFLEADRFLTTFIGSS